MAALILTAGALLACGRSPVGAGPAARGCTRRVIVIDGSSSARADDRQEFALDLVAAAAERAIVCDTALSAVLVSGPGQVRPMIATEDLRDLAPTGPNPTIRASRFDQAARTELRAIVERRLRDGYESVDASATSLPTMVAAAADLSSGDTNVIVVTDGVNQGESADLNRPLGAGEGAELARAVPVVPVEAASLIFVGVGLVDASTPAPSARWDVEVREFVHQVCRRAMAAPDRCQVRTTASIEELLR